MASSKLKAKCPTLARKRLRLERAVHGSTRAGRWHRPSSGTTKRKVGAGLGPWRNRAEHQDRFDIHQNRQHGPPLGRPRRGLICLDRANPASKWHSPPRQSLRPCGHIFRYTPPYPALERPCLWGPQRAKIPREGACHQRFSTRLRGPLAGLGPKHCPAAHRSSQGLPQFHGQGQRPV